MNITQNIQDLLYRHDCVILPGFGGFVANYKPAKVDYDRSIFLPPSKEISFNSQLQHNDGLLISDVSRSSGLAYIDSKRNVDEYIEDIKLRLEKGKKVVLDELGSFHFDKENLLQFEPDRTKNYLIDSFGLSSFEFSELEEYDVRKKIQKKQVKTVYPNSRKRKIIRRTLIAVPILVALVVIPLKTNLLSPKKDFLSMDPFNKTEIVNSPTSGSIDDTPVKKIDSASLIPETKQLDIESDENIEPEIHETETLVENSVEEPTSTLITESSLLPINYYVIAGSFESKINATRLQNSLIGSGYESKVLDPINGFYRVTLTGFSSFWEAKKGMVDYQKVNPGESYWILKK